jgi:hypothetical protein
MEPNFIISASILKPRLAGLGRSTEKSPSRGTKNSRLTPGKKCAQQAFSFSGTAILPPMPVVTYN